LLELIDRELGTKLSRGVGPGRVFTFREAAAACAVTWLDEKQRAATLISSTGGRLSARPAGEQFVIASLVYNSGLAFQPERWRMIEDFTSGRYLASVSTANAQKRWPLPVFSRDRIRAELLASGRYPDQPTSWNAVYHVLQRWGAYEALRRFTDHFDAHGTFR